jgi:hypothetical protein
MVNPKKNLFLIFYAFYIMSVITIVSIFRIKFINFIINIKIYLILLNNYKFYYKECYYNNHPLFKIFNKHKSSFIFI